MPVTGTIGEDTEDRMSEEELMEDVHEEEEDAEEGPQPGRSQAAAKQGKFPCIKCQKNVTKTQRGVRCHLCMLWVHADCQNISKDLYAHLKNTGKHGGQVNWQCDSCVAGTARLEARVAALEAWNNEIEARVVRNEGSVQEAVKHVDKVEARQDKVEKALENERERIRVERVVEMREREQRKKNVLIHRMVEAGQEAKTVEERREWDISSCANMFKELNLTWGREAIKFCRRVGERSDEPRPLIVGFMREYHKEDLLDKGRELQHTPFADIGIMPDLSPEQRKDEADLVKEAERRNTLLTADDRSKNLSWAVVGRKGEKRLLKGVERGRTTGWRGGQREASHPATGPRGGPWQATAGRGRGASAGRGAVRGGGYTGRAHQADREDLLQYVRGENTHRPRLNSKRLRENEEIGEEEDTREQPLPPTERLVHH